MATPRGKHCCVCAFVCNCSLFLTVGEMLDVNLHIISQHCLRQPLYQSTYQCEYQSVRGFQRMRRSEVRWAAWEWLCLCFGMNRWPEGMLHIKDKDNEGRKWWGREICRGHIPVCRWHAFWLAACLCVRACVSGTRCSCWRHSRQ